MSVEEALRIIWNPATLEDTRERLRSAVYARTRAFGTALRRRRKWFQVDGDLWSAGVRAPGVVSDRVTPADVF